MFGASGQQVKYAEAATLTAHNRPGDHPGGGSRAEEKSSPQGPAQRKHETELDSLAKTARDKGYSTQVQHSKTTNSSYLYVGHENESGGFTSVLKIRVSDHPKPGSKFGHDKKSNTVSVRTKDADKLSQHLASLPNRGGKGKVYDDSSGRGVFKEAEVPA